jgi:radical SAM/Cys-rich protein
MIHFKDKVPPFKALTLDTLQVNMGLRCNQACRHCHLECSPMRPEMMERDTVERMVTIIRENPFQAVDITGGAPELNWHFRYFIQQIRECKPGIEIMVRSNLTILSEEGQEDLADFYKQNNLHVIASMPCYLEENVDMIRGNRVYDRSISGLKKLNSLGYGNGNGHVLDLVYTPAGAALPPAQKPLEDDSKRELKNRHGVIFDSLLCMANMPIARFNTFLKKNNEYEKYIKLLVDNFNPETLEGLMCRHLISVGYDGSLYDCDFNQALGIKADHGAPNHISKFDWDLLTSRTVTCDEHCFGCTAGGGSSCGGALQN